jgi:hypothetical protein
MHYVSPNHFSDFVEVLYSIKKHSTTNEYFPMHITITTIYSLQEHNLNHGNYSEQELNMGNFAQSTEYDAHKHAMIQDLIIHGFL